MLRRIQKDRAKNISIQCQAQSILRELKSLSDQMAVEGMSRFGINPQNIYGVSIPDLRRIAKKVGKNHRLAQALWRRRVHEARILAGMIDEPALVSEKQMNRWAKDFDSWDVCDQVCLNLFDRTEFAYRKAVEWSQSDREFVKRAGFVLMAVMAVHNKEMSNQEFLDFFPLIKKGATDRRNYVKKAVNWALRQIGKRNEELRTEAIKLALEIKNINSREARWVANDALKELRAKVFKR